MDRKPNASCSGVPTTPKIICRSRLRSDWLNMDSSHCMIAIDPMIPRAAKIMRSMASAVIPPGR